MEDVKGSIGEKGEDGGGCGRIRNGHEMDGRLEENSLEERGDGGGGGVTRMGWRKMEEGLREGEERRGEMIEEVKQGKRTDRKWRRRKGVGRKTRRIVKWNKISATDRDSWREFTGRAPVTDTL